MPEFEIAARFRAIADILEIQGESPFKVRAYRNAADTIDDLELDNDGLAALDARGELGGLAGFGDAIVAKTKDFLATGTTALWERIRGSVPEGVVEIAGIPGIGPRTAKSVWEALGVTSVAALEAACHEEKIRALSGFGAAKEAALLEKIAAWRRLTEKVPRYRALSIAQRAMAELKKAGATKVALAGELRAGCDCVQSIEIEVEPPSLAQERPVQGVAVLVRAAAPDPLEGIPHELRHWPDILERARAGTLPELVTEADFRGQLHEHTTCSDGKNTIAEMAEAALARGYEYLAITDHSFSLKIANGLSRERLLAQMDEIEKLNGEFVPRGLTILTGIEADILQDGSLDCDDDLLERLDIVVGSVHRRFKESEAQMTRRITAALENPHLDILGHPTGRLLGRREGYAVDMDAIIAAAAKHGKALEINASPERMDLSDVHARRAKEAGALITINCDAHSVEGLGNLEWGLCMARRAGLEARDILNCRPLARLAAR